MIIRKSCWSCRPPNATCRNLRMTPPSCNPASLYPPSVACRPLATPVVECWRSRAQRYRPQRQSVAGPCPWACVGFVDGRVWRWGYRVTVRERRVVRPTSRTVACQPLHIARRCFSPRLSAIKVGAMHIGAPGHGEIVRSRPVRDLSACAREVDEPAEKATDGGVRDVLQ